jgi:DNA-binding transcriptional ArsR family regulator
MPANNMSYAKIDKDIVRVLETDELSATSIARRSRYGRTTINYRLRKLQSARMVSRSKVVGKEVFYVLNKKAANSARESRLIEVFDGPQLVQAYKYLTEAPRQSVIYCIQGAGAIRNAFKILPAGLIKTTHHGYKRKNIILKGFANKQALSTMKELDEEMIQSHIGRTVGLKLVDGDILLGSCELFCLQSVILMVNTAKRRVIVIKDKEIASLLYEILSMLYDVSNDIQVFSLNDYLKKLINHN